MLRRTFANNLSVMYVWLIVTYRILLVSGTAALGRAFLVHVLILQAIIPLGKKWLGHASLGYNLALHTTI